MATNSRTPVAPRSRRPKPAKAGENGLAPVETRSERTRRRVLDAAAKEFAARGYANTRLSDIATAADTQSGSLYYYFASKGDLVEAMLLEGVQEAHAQVAAVVDALPPETTARDRLFAAIDAHAQGVFGDRRGVAAAVARIVDEVPAHIRERVLQHERDYDAFLDQLFQTAQAEGEIRDDIDVRTVRMLIFSCLNSSASWPADLLHSENLVTTLKTITLEGIAPQPGTAKRRSQPKGTGRQRGGRA